MTESSKQALSTHEAEPEELRKAEGAVNDGQLDNVTGGTKKVDKASPVLMQACATGEHLKEATVTG